MKDTTLIHLRNLLEEDSEFANDVVLVELQQYISSLTETLRETRRKCDRKAERVFIKQLHRACIQASAFEDSDSFLELFEEVLHNCEQDWAHYPEHLRRTMVTGRVA